MNGTKIGVDKLVTLSREFVTITDCNPSPIGDINIHFSKEEARKLAKFILYHDRPEGEKKLNHTL